jgi:FixJ family two-component response regulator
MNGEPAIVFVVDDNRSVREGVTSLLASVGLRAERRCE